MNLDNYKNVILSVQDAIEVLLRGNTLDNTFIDNESEVSRFNTSMDLYLDSSERVALPVHSNKNFEDYHRELSDTWFIPDKYLHINVEQYILDLAGTPEEKQRVLYEMQLYNERNLEPVLRLIIYIVDLMREKNVVWGVGRGSSVSSYVLYLLGIHKVNSLKYELSIEEFLR